MTALRRWIGAAVAALHNLWAAMPLALQAALMVLAFAVYQFGLGYNWTLPTTWHELVTMTATFFVALWAFAFPIVRDKVWPALLPWLFKLLQLYMVTTSTATAAYQPVRVIVRWAQTT